MTAAHYRDETRRWGVTLEDGSRLDARFLITAIGPLSAPTMPRIEGVETFQGQSCHTARWPHEPVSFVGKRVAVIGTGATGVQTIQEVAKTVGHLTVFQRTPNWCAPHNGDQRQEQRKIGRLPEIALPGNFRLLPAHARSAQLRGDAGREAFFRNSTARASASGRAIMHTGRPQGERGVSDFVARKIRQRVKDQGVAEKLIPKNHGFGTRRVPLETKYYEVYNQPNVRLVDINETPIERITPKGIKTSDADYEFDIIIYATGFDAITGSFDRIDFRGKDGPPEGKWKAAPRPISA